MDYEQLKALVKDNAEAVTFIDGIKETSTNLTQTVNKNETLIQNLKGDLDKFKQGNNLVKSKLGLEQLNEDSLNEALVKASKGAGNDEEINNLKTMIDKLNNEKSTIQQDYESKLTNVQLDNLIANATAGAGIASDEAFSTVKTLLKSGVAIENGNAVYKNDGKTVFDSNNQPLTLQSKLESIKSNPIYQGFFQGTTKSGGGTQANQGQTQKASIAGDKAQRTQAIKEKFNL